MGIRILGLLTIVVSIAFISLESEFLSVGLTFFLAIYIHACRSNLVDEFSPRQARASSSSQSHDDDEETTSQADNYQDRVYNPMNSIYPDNVSHDHSSDY